MMVGEGEGQCGGLTQHHLEGMPCQGLPSLLPGKDTLRETHMEAAENDPRGPSRPRWIARAIIFIISQLWSQYTLLNTEWGKHRHGLIIAPDPGTCRNRDALGRLGAAALGHGEPGKASEPPKGGSAQGRRGLGPWEVASGLH